ncbi:MAG: hypothetical protein KF812_12835 [Fimbriimonadaceae bacterium]|nr:hypothetical protein [Fimbriimonadaceae bacterium]
MSSLLTLLVNALADVSSSGGTDDMDVRARAVLLHLLHPSRLGQDEDSGRLISAQCPNCGELTSSRSTPYCSPECREESAFVRQLRAAIESGAIQEADRQANFGQNLWHLLGGGYPRRVALIKPKEMSKLIARGCELCDAPAVTVDHTGSG